MKNWLKNNTIVVAFLLPILLILAVAASTAIPSLFLKTDYNFVYAICTDTSDYYRSGCASYIDNKYPVVNERLTVSEYEAEISIDTDYDRQPDIAPDYRVRFFLHDTLNNVSREVTLAEAQSLALNPLITSPDGVSVSYEYNRGADFFLIFDGGSSRGFYLTKGNSKRELNLINDMDRYYYYGRDNFEFIGWVLPARN